MKTFLVIISLLLWSITFSQQKHTISVPTESYQKISPATKVPNIKTLMDQIGHYANLYTSIQCLEKMNPHIEDALQKEMSRITEESPYILTVDYNSCQFYSLLPDKGTGGIFAPTSTVYYIKLYPKIVIDPVVKREPDGTGQKPLLATYTDANGNWIAMGPYSTSDPCATEKQAISLLFYEDGDLNFICERGKYRIYSLNEALKYNGQDIRQELKKRGVNNIPQ